MDSPLQEIKFIVGSVNSFLHQLFFNYVNFSNLGAKSFILILNIFQDFMYNLASSTLEVIHNVDLCSIWKFWFSLIALKGNGLSIFFQKTIAIKVAQVCQIIIGIIIFKKELTLKYILTQVLQSKINFA